MLVRRDGSLSTELRPNEEDSPTAAPAAPSVQKKPAANAAEVREKITDMVRKELPALTQAYNEGMKKEAARVTKEKKQEKKAT
jgi:hypothetical protein